MAVSTSGLIAIKVVNCMAEGKPPIDSERIIVAQRIWSDCGILRTAFGWDELPPFSYARLGAMRAAEVALCGVT